MSSLPIFEILYKECVNNNSELTNEDYKKIKETIENMEDHTILWCIIRIYNVKYNNCNNYFDIPYNGLITKNNIENNIENNEINDIQFDLTKFPVTLKHMIKNYINKYIKSNDEKKEILKFN